MRRFERLAVVTAALSFFISTLDTGIVNVALPHLTQALHVDASVAAWTISAYAAALSATILPFGWLGDRFGVARVSAAGFIVFGLFSIACALAPSAGLLIGFRALTGVGAAMLQGTASSFVTRYVDAKHRGSAFGWVSAILSLGVVLGPSAGGFIVSFASWRWIFLAAVPFGIAGCISARLLVHAQIAAEPSASGAPERTRGVVRAVPFIGAAALGAIFICAFVGSPFELTRQAHLLAWQVGLVLLASPAASTIAARAAGSLVQRGMGVRLIVAGLCVEGAVTAALLETPAAAIPRFVLLLFALGIGSGMLQTPVIALSLAAFPANAQSSAGALQRFVQNLTIAGGAALSGFFIDRYGPHAVWIFASAVAFGSAAAICALTIGAIRVPTRWPQLRASRKP